MYGLLCVGYRKVHSPGAQLPGREDDHSPSAEAKNVRSRTNTFQWLLIALCLINSRDKLTWGHAVE
jgi:hypothetical protein